MTDDNWTWPDYLLLYRSRVELDHFGIIHPGVAPSEHFHEIWEHYGMTTSALVQSIRR